MSITNQLARRAKSAHNWLYRRFDKPMFRTVKGMPILLVTVAGRKTGTPSTTPVLYFRDGYAFVVTGSGGGSVEPQWFRNLRKAATASIEVGSERMDVSVRIARDDEYRRLWERLLEVGPFFEGYRTKAGRDMPIAVLTPIR